MFMFNTCKKYFGWDSVTLTGGEPFVKNNIDEIIKSLSKCSANITIVSNGSLLDKHTHIGKYIQRINVSIHSLKNEIVDELVGIPNMLEKQLKGLYAFREQNPDVEIRLNSTLGEYNFKDEAFLELTQLAEDINASIKYIELYPKTIKGFIPMSAFEEKLVKHGYKNVSDTYRKVIYSNNKVQIGLTKLTTEIESTEENINDSLNNAAIFVSPDGKIYLFAMENEKVDIFDEVKNRNEKKLVEKIKYLRVIGREYCLKKELVKL